MAKKKTGLGRGLDALFADLAPVNEEDYEVVSEEVEEAFKDLGNESESKEKKSNKEKISKRTNVLDEIDDKDRIIYVDINDIRPNKNQPRKNFNEERLADLAKSIKENGVIQPIVVRKKGKGYEIVAGERRWRASRIAELKKIPCIVRDFDEKQNMIVAIIENMQREDLDPIEEALGIQAMTKKFEFTQEQVAESLGKSRTYITNSMRLLKLPDWIQKNISDGTISAAHGRTIINIDDAEVQEKICKKVIKDGLSVRETEKLADSAKDKIKPERKKRNKNTKSREVEAVEHELREVLGTKVNISGSEKSGKIELEYYSLDELNRLIDMLRELR